MTTAVLKDSLIARTRLLNRTLQSPTSGHVRFDNLAQTLGLVLDAKVAIVSNTGKILAVNESLRVGPGAVLSPEIQHSLGKIDEITDLSNFELTGIWNGRPIAFQFDHLVVIPVFGGGQRLGTLMINKVMNDEELVLAEYAVAVTGFELLHSQQEEQVDLNRKLSAAKLAVSSLSYSEGEAIVEVFRALGGTEGILVASKVADKVGITRSVIVNGLRKLESAGVINSRSLGMKGTYIKVLNDAILEELRKLAS